MKTTLKQQEPNKKKRQHTYGKPQDHSKNDDPSNDFHKASYQSTHTQEAQLPDSVPAPGRSYQRPAEEPCSPADVAQQNNYLETSKIRLVHGLLDGYNML